MNNGGTFNFRDKNGSVSSSLTFTRTGVNVFIKRNNITSETYVDDLVLARNITREVYVAFYRLIVKNKQKVDKYDFSTLVLKSNKLDMDKINSSITYLESLHISNYSDVWKQLKSCNAYAVALIYNFDWYSHQQKSIELSESPNVLTYFQSALTYIANLSTTIIQPEKDLYFRVLESLRFVGFLYPSDNKITIAFGSEIPNNFTVNFRRQSFNSYIVVFILLIVLIVLAWYGFKRYKEEKDVEF